MRSRPLIACTALVTGVVGALAAGSAAAAPTRYEAETSPAVCIGTIDSDWPGFSGSGFCNGDNATGAYAQFTVDASTAGAAAVAVRFANGSGSSRPADLIVNGTTVQSVSFEATGAWSTWVTKTVSVNVNAGSNTVRLNPTGSTGLPNVDYVEADLTLVPQTRYQAEDAPAVCDGTIDSNWSGYTGTGFCNGANAVGASLQFTVNASMSGSASLVVRFANGTTTSRLADVIVNGSRYSSPSFEGTGAWSTWAVKNLTIPVNSGTNTIRFSPTTSAGLPNIDFMDFVVEGPPPPPPPPPTNALYVATNGNDSSPGTLSQPLRTIQRAVDLAQAGYTIFIRGGTYAPSENIQILKNGTSSQPITMTNHNGEKVIIDGESMPYTPGDVGSTIPREQRGAIHIEGDWWRLIGLEIIHGPYGIFGLDSSNNVYERLITRDNYESGLHLVLSSSNNQIINLDSYGNRDPRKNGESADGLAIKEGSGSGNVVRGARLWNNSDDGLDFWEFSSPILVEDTLAWGNGFNRWNLPNYQGDGNGFKLGGNGVAANHTVRNSMAWDNAVSGFIDNNNPGQHRIERCTAWDNPGTGFDFDRSDSTLTKNLAAANGTQVSYGSNSGGSGNSWDIGGSWSFVSTDPSTITGPRNADGSIPSSTFLRPSNGADVGARF